MGRSASWGWGKGIDGREAARQAAQQALSRLGTNRAPAICLVFVSQEFEIGPVINGLTSVLGNVPLWGMSTSRLITPIGEQARSVVVGLLAGSDINAQVSFWPGFSQNSNETANQLIQALAEAKDSKGLLLAADGINGDISRICAAITGFSSPVAGGMASGDIFQGKTYQIAGNQFGSGGLAVATLEGPLCIGIGIGHGWVDVGVHFEISKTRDIWVQELGNLPAAEVYSRTLGYPAREWAFPPLKELVRLYPLGIEVTSGSSELFIRSPLQMEVDGSLRMNIPVAEKQSARLLIGDRNKCLEAAHQAARTALKTLAGAKPLLVMVLVDQAWQYLFQSDSTRLISAVKAETGEIPLLGAYTLGQVYRNQEVGLVRAYNQKLMVVVFGEN